MVFCDRDVPYVDGILFIAKGTVYPDEEVRCGWFFGGVSPVWKRCPLSATALHHSLDQAIIPAALDLSSCPDGSGDLAAYWGGGVR